MPSILALSSTVAVGHVGLAAMMPAAHLAGASISGLPTVVLSNHPGFAATAGCRIAPDSLREMIDAIDANGWLGDFTCFVTGYLPTTDHVELACETARRLRAAAATLEIICDPILGDDPKGVYIDPAAARAIPDRLIPLADTLLPNRFELEWLAGIPVTDAHSAITAARSLGLPRIIAKSIPVGPGEIANVEVTAANAHYTRHRRRTGVPNGTGDVFAGLTAAGWPFYRTAAALDRLAAASIGRPHLAIVESAGVWLTVQPAATDTVE